MGKKNLSVFLFALVAILGVGCSSIDRYFGHYEGTLLDRHDGEIFKHSVSVELKRDGSRASAEVIDRNGTALFYLSAMRLSQHSFLLQMPPPWSSEIRVHKRGNCFIGKKHSVSVCFSNEKFLFDFADQSGQSVFTLTADRFAHEEVRDEKPRKYTLS